MSALRLTRLGRLPWLEALERQEDALRRVREGGPDELLLTEHPPTVTLGRSSAPEHLRAPVEQLRARGIAVHEANRGGSVTWHGPGQLVGYPICDLRRLGVRPHAWLRLLEEALIDALDELGVEAFAREGLTGVWTTKGKLAAIGVAIRGGVSMHGFALNLALERGPEEWIVPCGLAEPVVDLRALGVAAAWDEVADACALSLQKALMAPRTSPASAMPQA